MSGGGELLVRAARVRLLLTDVDGVWTDGRLTWHEDGRDSACFHVHDGYGMQRLRRAGVAVAVVSGRDSPAVRSRFEFLGVDALVLGTLEKGPPARSIRESLGLSPEEVAAMGDDLPDLALFDEAGLCFAPPGAVAEVRARADLVTRAPAGAGALREVCDLILRARGVDPAEAFGGKP